MLNVSVSLLILLLHNNKTSVLSIFVNLRNIKKLTANNISYINKYLCGNWNDKNFIWL